MPGRTKHGLLAKSREAALTAVQTYNNPLVKFKSETFIVLMMIAWTYLLHAHYSRRGIEFRYRDHDPKSKRKFQRNAQGGYRFWELASCIKVAECPLDNATRLNLDFLIGLRNQIEHHRPPHLDDHMSGRYLACALNFEYWMCELFGPKYGLGDTVAMALHFRDLKPPSTAGVEKLPSRLSRYITEFEGGMTQEEYDDPRFAFRLFFTPKTANRKGQADRAVEFLKPDDPRAAGINPELVVIKDTEKAKYRAKDVVAAVQAEGHTFFRLYEHTLLWKRLDAKDPGKGYGVMVTGTWYWYATWVTECIAQCEVINKEQITIVSPRRT